MLKNKLQPRKHGDPISIITRFVNHMARHLAARRALQGAVKMEGFIRRGWGQGATRERRERVIGGLGHLCFGEG